MRRESRVTTDDQGLPKEGGTVSLGEHVGLEVSKILRYRYLRSSWVCGCAARERERERMLSNLQEEFFFKKYLLNTYYVPDVIHGIRDITYILTGGCRQ